MATKKTTKTVAKKKTTTATKKTKSVAAKKQPRQVAKKQVVKEVVQQQEVQEVKPKRRLKKKYIVFLCLYALSFILYYSVTSFAKYSSYITKSGSIAVAKWDVSLSGNDSETLPTIVIGDDSTYQEYNLTVTSNSEVAITYTVVLTNVPQDLWVTVGDNSYSPDSNGRITIPDLGSFSALDNNSTHVHKLTFVVPIDSEAFNNETIDIDVVFSQVEL